MPKLIRYEGLDSIKGLKALALDSVKNPENEGAYDLAPSDFRMTAGPGTGFTNIKVQVFEANLSALGLAIPRIRIGLSAFQGFVEAADSDLTTATPCIWYRSNKGRGSERLKHRQLVDLSSRIASHNALGLASRNLGRTESLVLKRFSTYPI